MRNAAVVREKQTQIGQIDDDLPRLTAHADGVRVALTQGEDRETAKRNVEYDHAGRSPVGGAAWPLVNASDDAKPFMSRLSLHVKQLFLLHLWEFPEGGDRFSERSSERPPRGGMRGPDI